MKDTNQGANYYVKAKKNKDLSGFFVGISILFAFSIFFTIFITNFDSYYISTQKAKQLKELWVVKRYLDVINLSDKILIANPVDKDALFYGGLASFYYLFEIPDDFEEKRKEYREKALKSLRVYRLIDKNYDPEVDYVIGLIYYYEGTMFEDLAKKYLARYYDKNPNNEEVLIYLGLLTSKSEELDESNEYFSKLLAKDFKYKYLIYLELAKNFIKVSNFEKAETYINLFLESNPSKDYLEQAYFLKARILMLEGKMDLASEEYDKILQVNEKSSDAHYYRGELYEKLGKHAEARYEWREALRLDPTNKKPMEKLQN